MIDCIMDRTAAAEVCFPFTIIMGVEMILFKDSFSDPISMISGKDPHLIDEEK